MTLAPQPHHILRFLACKGADTVLVTLAGIAGSASRAVGSQMAVAGDGSHCGSLSGGCIDAAVVAEALEVLAERKGRLVRFGAGSPYIDLKLPCGGSIDLLFTPRPDPALIDAALQSLAARRSFGMTISADRIAAFGADGEHFALTYSPPLQLIAVGQGDDLSAFVRLATSFGAAVVAVMPDDQPQSFADLPQITCLPAISSAALPPFATDPWTAIVFLFHDRDWEEVLLAQALEREAFYYGAVGSPRTQAARRAMLEAAGVAQTDIAKLRQRVGLIPSTRDPATLALSVLAEVVAAYAALVARTTAP
jgi:xanthine dehydrogenase accessory factor